MKQILAICGLLIILLVAVLGCMVIFDVITMELAESVVLKWGGAIVLLGICSALVKMLMSSTQDSSD